MNPPTDPLAPASAKVVALSLAAVGGAAVLLGRGSEAFTPFYGSLHPVLATGGVAFVGLGALLYLHAGGWLSIDRVEAGTGRLVLPVLLASGLAIPVVLVDVAGGFPEDLNVLPPDGLLFYPTIALVAEMVFHVVPLAGLLVLLHALGRSVARRRLLSAGLLIVATPEPIFQVVSGLGESPGWASAYVGFHLLVFNVAALLLFRRYGFVSMYALRFTYYVHWHIVWGVLRLHLLF